MDMSLVSAVTGNLNAGLQVVKAIVGMKVDAAVTAKTVELQGILATAMSQVLELQQGLIAAHARVRELEAEKSSRSAFDADAGRYDLRAVAEGGFAYALKSDAANGQPEHWLCASCFDQRKKSILQYAKADLGRKIYACPNCQTQIFIPIPAAGITIETAGRRRLFGDLDDYLR
jgi:hypothetical protein